MTLLRRVFDLYRRVLRTYRTWSPQILLLALAIFLPLGLIDALVVKVEVSSIDLDSGAKIAAALLAVGAIATTGLVGEIFFSGAIALSLTHPQGEGPPSLREIARRISYRRLIAVDVAVAAIVLAGLALAFVPGLIALVYLSLAGPLVEIGHETSLGALKRSARLVRGSFWFVFWVVVPIELAGDAVGSGVAALAHGLLGHTFLAEWVAETLSNVVLSPVFAVGAVLLALELMAAREGGAPPLRTAGAPA